MGSYSASTSNALDNRQAITDQAFGISASGSGNNTALSGHIFNIGSALGTDSDLANNSLGNSSNRSDSGDGGGGGGFSINVLDNDAISKSFDFAAFSLSEILGKLIQSEKTQKETTTYTVDTIGKAIQESSKISAAAAAASAAAGSELNKDTKAFLLENGKKVLMFGGVALAAYLLFSWGKK